MSNPAHGDDYGRKASKPFKGKSDEVEFRGFVNVDLTQEHKANFAKWFASGEFWDALSALVADGVVISVKPDPKGKGFQGAASQKRKGSPNAGLVCTARGADPAVALGRIVYTVAYLSLKERWEDTQAVAGFGDW